MAENRFKKSVDMATSNTAINLPEIEHSYDNADAALENIIGKARKDRGSNHTLYLSAEVGEALSKLTKKTKQSKSALVNDILKVFLTENKLL